MADPLIIQPVNAAITIRPVAVSPTGQEVSNTQTQLAALPPGTVLTGFVLNRDANNNPILRTPTGDLQLQSEVFVKTGSQLVIRVDATAESRARIVTIDGLEPAEYAAQNAPRGIAQDTIVASPLLSRPTSAAPGAAPQNANQPPLQAMLLSATPPGAAPHPLLAALPSGSVVPPLLMKLQSGAALKVTLLQWQLPGEITGPSSASQPLLNVPTRPSQTGAPPSQPLANQPPVADKPPLQGATMASAQETKAALPQILAAPNSSPLVTATPPRLPVASPIPAATAPANTLPGVVIGHEADGGNVVHTHFGTLKIFTPAPLPIHSQLTLQVEPGAKLAPEQTLQPSVVAPTGQPDELNSLSRDWPKLTEALTQLGLQDPTTMRDLSAAIPQTGHKLASGMLFFMSAVKGGDLQQWLGKRALSALESKLPELAAKLKGDMGQLQQLMLHSPLDHWSGVMIPLLHEGQLEYARMYLRDESSEGGEKQAGKGKDQRFIVEVEMSHLGEIQFDGFVRQGVERKQFDLMIRSARPLPEAMTGEIRTLFESAMGSTGYNGYLAFQQGPQHFVRPLAGSEPNRPTPHDHTILA